MSLVDTGIGHVLAVVGLRGDDGSGPLAWAFRWWIPALGMGCPPGRLLLWEALKEEQCPGLGSAHALAG